jgi:hypothetical protein
VHAIEMLSDIAKRTESANRILFLIAEDETVAPEIRDRAEVKLANARARSAASRDRPS